MEPIVPYYLDMPDEPTSPGRGRPREFEIDDIIRDAMGVFQTLGYQGASMEQLVQGTGLSRGSLYKVFPDKRALFLAALERYTTENTAKLRDCLAEGSAREAIRSALMGIAEASALATGERGCLVVSSTAEMASKDLAVKAHLEQTLDRIQGLIGAAIRRGQEAGEIPSKRDVEALARFFLCTIEGLGVLGKTGRTREDMASIVDAAMNVLV